MRRLILAAALVLGAGLAVPIATSSTPAWAINCAYGDNFYQFNSDLSGDYSATLYNTPHGHAGNYLTDVSTGGTLYCQTAPITAYGLGWAEWVQKGTSNCLTFDLSDGNVIRLDPCQQLDAQYWSLQDQLKGVEDWGNVLNAYQVTSSDTSLWDLGYAGNLDFGECLSFTSPPTPIGCNAHSTHFDWSLVGPYR